MAKAQKFGAFGGVFVPSVLTILGVIMYLRLGWVVGNAGLVGTIIIILIAHVISVTTGLSVSSIATDKKVKAGGIYYMLSRSLGLPIGGAIGIALFVATALSIAMYIVGFGESFNTAVGFSSSDMDAVERVNNLRITGTITLMVVTTIALVSTSLAIKTQYYILGAIALSIISIFAGGLFLDHGLSASAPALFSGEGSASMETVFAIFFPAVTGFTAGVAMSGDLKDPKKSIPMGTMAAIAVGLVVYIALAVFLANTIDGQALREDTNILAKIALFSAYGAPFLMAGIWGATLSSALGGILGGPRILQAMSLDKVTPKLFGKGVGKSNEPRNALLFAFVIAEGGILIGELDLIAPIVSMFYLTAYGFINLTSALESWSGSDFRPTFKIPRAISLLGAIATFGVMFKLDMMAMFASFIVIGVIFLYLTKKQINLGFSDVWQGVWSEVVRTALFRLSQRPPDKRSWRPNIILFSGSTERRPHLLEYGQRLVGRLGLLSNFDLVEDQNSVGLFAQRDQVAESSDDNKGVFTRKYSCQDIYSGIERIAETYGFSGLEPNTVLMGWVRYTKDPVRFSLLIQKFQQLDYSLLIMDYDQEAGFGKKRRIDIWWEGTNRHVTFPLTISRFLNTADDWQNAAIRLYIVADTSQVDDALIAKKLDNVQEELRVTLDLKIINSALDHRTFYEIVQSESSAADLVYLELPELQEGSETAFFQKTDALCKEIGTVILYKASKEFESIELGLGQGTSKRPHWKETPESDIEYVPSAKIPTINLPRQPVIAENFRVLDQAIERIILNFYEEFLKPYAHRNSRLVQIIQEHSSEAYAKLSAQSDRVDQDFVAFVSHQQRELLGGILQILEDFQTHELKAQEQIFSSAIDKMAAEVEEIIVKCPPHLVVTYDEEQLLANNGHDNFDWWQRTKSKVFKKPPQYRFNFQKLTSLQLNQHLQRAYLEIQKQINQDSDHFSGDLRKYLRRMAAGLQNLKTDNGGHYQPEKITAEIAQVEGRFQDLQGIIGSKINAYRDYLITDSRIHLQQFAELVDEATINKEVRSRLKSPKQWARLHAQITDAATAWGYNQPLNFNVHQLEIRLLSLQNDLWQQVIGLLEPVTQIPHQMVIQKIDQLISNLQRLKEDYMRGKTPKKTTSHEIGDFTKITECVKDFKEASIGLCKQLPQQLQVPHIQSGSEDPTEEFETIDIAPQDIVKYFIQTELIAPLEVHSGQLLPVLIKADHTILDVQQVVNLSFDSKDAELDLGDENFSAKLIEAIDEEISRLLDSRGQTEQFQSQLLNGLNKNFKAVSEHLNAHSIIKSALDFDYYLRSQKQSQVINKFNTYSQNVKNYVLAGLTTLYYRRSEGVIAARRFQGNKWGVGTWSDRMSKMMQEISPQSEVLEGMPFYYKQLFLRPHSVGKELWVLRDQDLQEASNAVSHYKRVRSGGLLILGAPLSGKTYLSEFIAGKYTKEAVYTVNPPEEGSIRPRVFQQTLKKSLRYYGELEAAFENLKPDSVVIFNDIELWWERSAQGFEVLDQLIKLVDDYGHKLLFIINMNMLAFRLVNNIKKIEDSFFKILKPHPFNAEELKDVILIRHQTSRLKFKLEGKDEDSLSQWTEAKLFTKYFDLSQGNVGVALQQWIGNINSISDDGVIQIRYPKPLDLEVLRNLDKDHAILLIQVILHKRLNAERMQRILKTSGEELAPRLEVLKRLDILRERNGVWEINRFLQPFLIAAFKEDFLI